MASFFPASESNGAGDLMGVAGFFPLPLERGDLSGVRVGVPWCDFTTAMVQALEIDICIDAGSSIWLGRYRSTTYLSSVSSFSQYFGQLYETAHVKSFHAWRAR